VDIFIAADRYRETSAARLDYGDEPEGNPRHNEPAADAPQITRLA